MARLIWGDEKKRLYESGVDRGVLYVPNKPAVVWDGLVSVAESLEGGDAKPHYIDGRNYQNTFDQTSYEATITAFSAPKEFDECDGRVEIFPGYYALQQRRKTFALAYRSMLGGVDNAYRIHILYSLLASPGKRGYKSVDGQGAVETMTWPVTGIFTIAPNLIISSKFTLDSREVPAAKMATIENALYGTVSTNPRLIYPDEMTTIINS